jgi:UPF0271 protein
MLVSDAEKMLSVDLNCDMGESFGAWRMGNDAELMDHVSSVSIACGFHAGDATTIRKTVELAVEKGVAIGAHPSYPDLQGFGRRDMSLSMQEVFDIILYQVAALKGICEASGGRLHHVKPHGALYNRAARDGELAHGIARAVWKIDPGLVLYGLSGSYLISEAENYGLQTASEVFADRTYSADGTLTVRSRPDALIADTRDAVNQVLQMIRSGTVEAVTGETIPIKAETICIHGDGDHAVEFAREIERSLVENSVEISSPPGRQSATQ